jgi:proliferating cell nuclear antigen
MSTEVGVESREEKAQRARFVLPAREWRYIIEGLAAIVEEASFVATPEGLKLRALDPGRVAMVDLFMPPTAFEEYSCPAEVKFAVELENVIETLRRVHKDDKVAFEVSDGRIIVTLLDANGRIARRFRLPLLDTAVQELPAPKLNFTVAAKVLSDAFRDALKDAELFSDSVRLKAEGESLLVTARSDRGEVETRFSLSGGSLVEISVEKPAEAAYGVELLSKIVSKAYRVSEVATLRFAASMPLELTLSVAGGGTLKYFVAPRAE